jgi:hypothetical protein
MLWTDPSGKCVPWIDPTCAPFWETDQGPNWQDGAEWFVGVGEAVVAPVVTAYSLTQPATWETAGRGAQYLWNDPQGAAGDLREEFVDPVVRGGELAISNPGRAVQILNHNPRAVGQVLGSTAISAFGARTYLRGRSAPNVAREPLTRTSSTYLEYRALRLQGYTSSEAYAIMKQLRAGNNPSNAFVFHFTSTRGGSGIIESCYLRVGPRQFRGPGIYAGTTPTPSWLLKHMPAPSWELTGNYPVRIPVKIKPGMAVEYYYIPWRSARIPMEPGSVLPLEP